MNTFDVAEKQIIENKKKVDFDLKAFEIEFLLNKFNDGDFYIPDYQRGPVWSLERASKFIESVILDLPIPLIFVADIRDKNATYNGKGFEIVDGSNCFTALSSFVKNEFPLQKLEILTEMEQFYFRDLSPARRKKFLRTMLRMIMISEESDPSVRLMMSERYNIVY